MSESTLDPPERLLQHAAWLRRLARRLVRDEAHADDLVQDAWVAVLSSGGPGGPGGDVPEGRMRGWLRAVVTNLARQGQRSEGRRREREQLAADARVEPAADELVERALRGRELTDLVLGLEEPFRRVVLLRFYEDLPPRKIAGRLGVPVRTVDSRLARGVARLRERWLRAHADRDGRWRALCLLAAPRPSWLAGVAGVTGAGSAPLLASVGVVIMNVKWIVASVLLAATGGLALWWGPSARGPEALTPGSPVLETGASVLDSPVPSPRAVEDARRAPAADPAPGSEVVHAAPGTSAPPTTLLHGSVRGPDSAPRAGIELALTAPGQADQRTRSGADGTFEFERPPDTGFIRAVSAELVTVLSGEVRAHRQVDPLVVVAAACDLAGRVEDEHGAPLVGVDLRWVAPDGFHHRFEIVYDTTRVREWRTASDEQGRFAMQRMPVIAGAILEARLDGYRTTRVDAPLADDAHAVLVLRRPPGERAIAGRVVDRDGRAAPAARVSLGARSATTDSAGEFLLDRSDATEVTRLVAIRRGSLPGTFEAPIDAQGRPAWPEHVLLELGGPPLSISGRVVDGDGRPRAGVRVWIEDPTAFGILDEDTQASVEYAIGLPPDVEGEQVLNRSYWDSVLTEGDGTFRLEGLLPRPYTLRALELATLQSTLHGPVEAGTSDLELELPGDDLRRIAGSVRTLDGAPAEGVRVHLYAWCYGGVSTALGRGAVTTGADGRFDFSEVGRGRMHLWLTGDAILPMHVDLDPEQAQERLEVTVVARCHFKVDASADPALADSFQVLDADGQVLELHVVSTDGVWRTQSVPLSAALSPTVGVVQTAATLVLRRGGEETRRLDLRVTPGELVVVRP